MKRNAISVESIPFYAFAICAESAQTTISARSAKKYSATITRSSKSGGLLKPPPKYRLNSLVTSQKSKRSLFPNQSMSIPSSSRTKNSANNSSSATSATSLATRLKSSSNPTAVSQKAAKVAATTVWSKSTSCGRSPKKAKNRGCWSGLRKDSLGCSWWAKKFLMLIDYPSF